MDKKARVLVADARPEVVTSTLRLLNEAGYEALGADSGAECLRMAQSRRPDLILLGVALPDTSGVDLCKQISRDPELADIYLVLTSSQEVPSSLQARGLEAGADAYIVRPIPNRELLARLGVLLRRRRDAARLKSALDDLQDTLDAMNDAVYVVDLQGKVARCNLALAKLLGKPISEIVGHSCFQVVHGTSGRIQACLLERAIQSRHRETLIVPLKERWLQVVVDPLLDEDDNVMAGVHVLSDVTERRQSEDALQREDHLLSVIVNRGGAWVVVTDAEGHIVRLNQTAEQASGYTLAEVEGKLLWDAFVPPEEAEPLKGVFDSLRDGHFASDFENTWVVKDGSRRRIAWSHTAVLDPNGALEFVAASGVDVTEPRRREAALQEERDWASRVMDRSGDLLAVLDAQGRIVRFNQAFQETLGYAADEVLGKPVQMLGPDLRSLEDFRSLRNMETAWLARDGSERWVAWSATPLMDGQGTLQYVVCSGQDVTQRKQAEQSLREERDWATHIADKAGALLLVLDPEGCIVRFNQACEQTTGYTFAEVQGRAVWDVLLPPEEVPSARAVFASLLTDSFVKEYENYWVTKNGTRRLILWCNTPLVDEQGAVRYVVASGTDIHDRHQAQLDLQISHERYRLAAEAAAEWIYTWELPNGLIAWKRGTGQDTAYEFEELPAEVGAWEGDLHPDDRERVLSALQRHLLTGEPFREEYRVLGNDGLVRYWLDRAAVLRDAEGRPRRRVGAVSDVTAHREAEQALQASVRAAWHLLNTPAVEATLLDSAGTILALNASAAGRIRSGLGGGQAQEAAERLRSGQAEEAAEPLRSGEAQETAEGLRADGVDLVGKNLYELLPVEAARQRRKLAERVLDSGQPVQLELEEDGAWLQVAMHPVLDEQSQPARVAMLVVDRTAQQRTLDEWDKLQAGLVDLREAEAVRTLTSRIANEFNSLSTAIMGNAEVSLSTLEASHPLQRKLSTMHKAARRLAALTGDLMARSQPTALQLQPLDLNALVDEFTALLSAVMDPVVRLDVDLAPELGSVQADATALRQVLLSLVLNAWEALPRDGVLSIETARRTLEPAFCKGHPEVQPGEYVRLSVGASQPAPQAGNEDARPRPLPGALGAATPLGKGLSLVQGIVLRHGGLLQVNEKGHSGLWAEVFLPLAPQAVDASTG